MTSTTRQDARCATAFDHATIVRSALFWGADRARSLSDLAESLQLSRRQVEVACQELALTGYVPLVAGPIGVYLEADAAAVGRCVGRSSRHWGLVA